MAQRKIAALQGDLRGVHDALLAVESATKSASAFARDGLPPPSQVCSRVCVVPVSVNAPGSTFPRLASQKSRDVFVGMEALVRPGLVKQASCAIRPPVVLLLRAIDVTRLQQADTLP